MITTIITITTITIITITITTIMTNNNSNKITITTNKQPTNQPTANKPIKETTNNNQQINNQ